MNSLMSNDFSDFYNLFRGPLASMDRSFSTDVQENDNELVFHVELPGLTKEDVKIMCKDGVLTINVEKKKETHEDEKYLIREIRSFESMSRSFRVGRNIDASGITAKFTDGILEIHVPKKEVEEKSEYIKID